MNAGMYGMADGRGMAGRKLIGSVYSGTLNSQQPGFFNAGTLVNTVTGRNSLNVSLTPGVRTKVLSITGRGASRLIGFNVAGVNATVTMEVWIDGILLKTFSQALASGAGFLAIGIGGTQNTYPSLVPDYVPFDSSLEVYLTSDIALPGSGGAPFGHWTDIHQ